MKRILLVGNPGSGKLAKARQLYSDIGGVSENLRVELAWIYYGARLDTLSDPAFRAPHHTCSEAGLVGGGSPARPGEVSLAHGGCLVLDELTEFRTRAIESLAIVLRNGLATHCRAGVWTNIPAIPQLLIATTNPCPCAYHGSSQAPVCRCSEESRVRYTERVLSLCSLLCIDEVVRLGDAR